MDVALLVVDGVADSGLALLRDVFVAANLLGPRLDLGPAPFAVTVRAVRARVRTAYGLQMSADPLRAVLDSPPDLLIAPSLGLVGADEIVRDVSSSDALPALRALHARGVALAGACSGSFFLAEAGVLTGRAATTSWWLGPTFRARYPQVRLDESQALVVADGVTTAGAAMAHLDLGLSIVARTSPALRDLVADYLAVGDRPRQSEVARPLALPTSDPVLAAFDRAVRANLAGPLSIAGVAREIGVSQRTLQRLTRAALGVSPVRYVQQVRLERATELLRSTDASVAAVAHAVGYQDATTLGTLIRRRRGTTPAQLRRRRDELALSPTG